ncbi:uncharacterized protein LOC119458198 isoform X3 [Dermacentor silvarum]|nr:uncharacterized protein LOC119458198 isoform X3 [Dermacentor silvarum]
MQTLRDCGSDYVVYSNSTRLPEGGVEFEQNCGLFLKQIECSQKFGDRCLENLARVVTTLALKAAEEDFEAACTEGNERNDMYKASIKCMNSVGAKLNVCIKNLYEGLQTAVSNAQREEIVYYSCCSYHSAVDCTEAALADCDEPDSPANEYVSSVMERVFGQVLGLVCGPYFPRVQPVAESSQPYPLWRPTRPGRRASSRSPSRSLRRSARSRRHWFLIVYRKKSTASPDPFPATRFEAFYIHFLPRVKGEVGAFRQHRLLLTWQTE